MNNSDSFGVTARAIEDWLIKASERTYQTAFCQLLNAMDYTVVHSTSHGAAEEGKDVIALNADGQPVAFQLKQGNLSLNGWRKIEPQIVELVEQPIHHSSIQTADWHEPVLVTNGNIHEEVIRRIHGRNRRWRTQFKPLRTWSGNQLLTNFLDHTKEFLPQEIPDFHRFLGLLITDGRRLLDKDEFDRLLKSVLPAQRGTPRPSRSQAERTIAASAVITQYATGSFDRVQNHFAKVEAYVMNACYVWATADRLRLAKRSWKNTVSLLETALDRAVCAIMEEGRDLVSGKLMDPHTEPVIGPLRYPLVGGVLAAHGLWCKLGGHSEWLGDKVDEVRQIVSFCCERSQIASEYFVPACYLMTEFLRRYGHVRQGAERFQTLLAHSILRKIPCDRPAFWHPYVSPEDAVMCQLGKPVPQDGYDAWEKTSYTGWPMILIAVRRGLRQMLTQLWRPITELQFMEARPVKDYEGLFWRFEGGKMHQHQVLRPTSWAWLQEQTQHAHEPPRPTLDNPHWLPYYLLVYPHRFNAGSVLALDDRLTRTD